MDQENALETIRSLAPLAAEKMRQILNDPKSSQYAKIQVITLILNRTYGMPESSVKLASNRQSMEESIACVRDLFRDLEEKEKEDGGEETEEGIRPGADSDGPPGADRTRGGVQGPDEAARGMDP
ncbi:MAG: hypothetical protein IJK06_05460 [Clostridia bacterium]|nr:hypothetical protein [Clostridia bacterium]